MGRGVNLLAQNHTKLGENHTFSKANECSDAGSNFLSLKYNYVFIVDAVKSQNNSKSKSK